MARQEERQSERARRILKIGFAPALRSSRKKGDSLDVPAQQDHLFFILGFASHRAEVGNKNSDKNMLKTTKIYSLSVVRPCVVISAVASALSIQMELATMIVNAAAMSYTKHSHVVFSHTRTHSSTK